ncbi:MAG: DUF600 family protein [Ruminococcus sp.]|nr:DUF600 family protein [Ruminococcus sp.]
MHKIENAQKELCEFLIEMMPVEWSKICYYSKCTTGSRSSWIALIEKQTGIICPQESFWKRYSSYPYEEMVAYVKLNKLTRNLFNAYLEKFGEEKIWCTYSLTIEDDYSFHVDLGYEMPEGNLVEQHDEVYRNFFNKEYMNLEGKYPY